MEKPRPELTVVAVLLGVVLALVMGAANVYLGLKAGMTVSASIPAAVVGMGVLRGVFRRRSVLEANMVQTGASAGESLAAGIIFTVPALVMAGIWASFREQYWAITGIACAGGLLGILFMIPMRRTFVVESRELPYPEGVACAEVLNVGQEDDRELVDGSSAGLKIILVGVCIGAAFKFIGAFAGLLKGTVQWATARGSHVFYLGCDMSPALLSVGMIVGLRIAFQVFLGGAIGWLIAIPLLSADADQPDAVAQAWSLWSSHVRYMGVGAMLVGGLVSLWKVRRGLLAAAVELFGLGNRKQSARQAERCDRDLPGWLVGCLALGTICLIAAIYYWLLERQVAITLVTTLMMIAMAFFFTAVASYIVGLVGNSNSPVSGMTIMALLATGLLMYWLGFSGTAAVVATLGVAGVVCCAACTSGDVCNDLKTGHLVGASPRNQQIMQVLGVIAACFVMGPVLEVLHVGHADTGGIGGTELTAPQATLMKDLTLALFGTASSDSAPMGWMITLGAGIGLLLLVVNFCLYLGGVAFRLHVMPVAVGIYLPLGISVPILLGGLLHEVARRSQHRMQRGGADRGVLAASGIIAGESLAGIAMGVLVYCGMQRGDWGQRLVDAEMMNGAGWNITSLVALAAVALWLLRSATAREEAEMRGDS